jgi:hypothetical protein
MLLRIFMVGVSISCVLAVGCTSTDSGEKEQPAEAAAATPAPAEAAPAPAELAAESAGWKERFQKSLDAIEASEDPWATTCEQIDTMQKAWAEGDPEVKRLLKFEEQWVRLGAKLSRSQAFCGRNEKPVLPTGSDFVKDLKNPWEVVKAKLP